VHYFLQNQNQTVKHWKINIQPQHKDRIGLYENKHIDKMQTKHKAACDLWVCDSVTTQSNCDGIDTECMLIGNNTLWQHPFTMSTMSIFSLKTYSPK